MDTTSIYHVDALDRIVEVNDAWLLFARQNAWQVERSDLIGQPLWRFLTDPTTINIYQLVMERARQHDAPIQMPFRCDSPTLKRFMTLKIRHQGEGLLIFEGQLERLEHRDPLSLPEGDPLLASAFVTMCGWCKKIRTNPRQWQELEEAIATLNLFEAPHTFLITHGMCEGCFARINRKLNPKKNSKDPLQ